LAEAYIQEGFDRKEEEKRKSIGKGSEKIFTLVPLLWCRRSGRRLACARAVTVAPVWRRHRRGGWLGLLPKPRTRRSPSQELMTIMLQELEKLVKELDLPLERKEEKRNSHGPGPRQGIIFFRPPILAEC